MLVEPSWLVEVISVMPAMRPNCRSSGVATEEAMVSGLAPGRPALTGMVGKSTCGSGDTGRNVKATPPASAGPRVSSDVATGRRINGAEIFMQSPAGSGSGAGPASDGAEALRQPVKRTDRPPAWCKA